MIVDAQMAEKTSSALLFGGWMTHENERVLRIS